MFPNGPTWALVAEGSSDRKGIGGSEIGGIVSWSCSKDDKEAFLNSGISENLYDKVVSLGSGVILTQAHKSLGRS